MIIYIAAVGWLFVLGILVTLSAREKDVEKLKESLGNTTNKLRESDRKIHNAMRYATAYRDKTTYRQKLEDGDFWAGICSVIEELDPDEWETGPIDTEDILDEYFNNEVQ